MAPYANRGLFRISASGGDLVVVTRPDSTRGETGHRFPQFLPDGKHFLYSALPAGVDGKVNVWIGSLDGGKPDLLLRVETAHGAKYCEPGWIVFPRGNGLVAQRFDVRSRKLRGEPLVLGDVSLGSNLSGNPVASLSNSGSLALPTDALVPNRLSWINLEGQRCAVPLAPGPYVKATLAPDRRRALLGLVEHSHSALVIADLERGVITRVTEPPSEPGSGAWSPDGQRIFYADENGGASRLIVQSLTDGTQHTWFNAVPAFRHALDWSKDGKYLLYEQLDATTKWDLWAIEADGDSTPRLVVRSPANDNGGLISPDGRWVAYTSDESGPPEVFVQPFLAPGMRYQVTVGGGFPLGWSPDGRNLAFIDFKHVNEARQAPVVLVGNEFSLGPAKTLLKAPDDLIGGDFDAKRDLVLALRPPRRHPRQTITVVQNWEAALRKP